MTESVGGGPVSMTSLVWARDLLRDDIGVRDHFRGRFSHLLIDEAQDTDPIQAEIAMFLSERDAVSR